MSLARGIVALASSATCPQWAEERRVSGYAIGGVNEAPVPELGTYPRIRPGDTAPVWRGSDREQLHLTWGRFEAYADGRQPFVRSATAARGKALALRTQRCLVPATAIFVTGANTPPPTLWQAFRPRDEARPFAMAGIWYAARMGGPEWFRIVTLDPQEPGGFDVGKGPRGGRQRANWVPVVVPRSAWPAWLDPGNQEAAALARMLVPHAHGWEIVPQ